MRLDKYIAASSHLSRTQARRAARAGLVLVDGRVIKSGAEHIADDAEVIVDGQPLKQPGPRYFMLNKPAGYVCATEDQEHPTVLDLMSVNNSDKLQIAGRLDIDTTGLVLITDDGQWNHRVTSPKRQCEKIYEVNTKHPIAPETVEKFAEGVQLDSERERTRPAKLLINDPLNAMLAISEGKYHQVKRMFAATGNRVEALHRTAVGKIQLDLDLAEGEYRALTDEERDSI